MLLRPAPPLVTIAIPTYNRADSYLPQVIKGALNQTYPRIEVLVSDNASTDQTSTLVRGMHDRRLRYARHQTNIGANRNFNYCLGQAKGDYFLLLHDDDMIDPDFVDSCVAAANYKTEVGLVRTGIRVIDERGRVIRESRNTAAGLSVAEYFLAWFAGKTSWYLANTLFHTGRLRAIGGFQSPHQLVEDGFAIAKLAALAPRRDVADVKSSFRVHSGEKTFAGDTVVLEWGRDYLELLGCLCRIVPPEKASEVRKQGMRFFARLTYDRASAIKNPADRIRAYAAVCRLFDYRHLPAHRIVGRQFLVRALDVARRQARRFLDYRTGQSALSR